MPQLIVEATLRLAASLDFPVLFAALHRRLAAEGHGAVDDFCSRADVAAVRLAGNDPQGEFLFARVVIMDGRTPARCRALATSIHDALVSAIHEEALPYWWQCHVLCEPHAVTNCLSTDSRRGKD
jgi:5-carboxymethyl-2-hydroxymuconate isomerase